MIARIYGSVKEAGEAAAAVTAFRGGILLADEGLEVPLG